MSVVFPSMFAVNPVGPEGAISNPVEPKDRVVSMISLQHLLIFFSFLGNRN